MQSIQKVQKAIYELINSQTTGELANISGIFHDVPQETNFPYIYFSENKVEEISNFKDKIFKVNIELSVFDKNKSNSKVITLCEEAVSLITNISNLNVEDYSVLDCRNKGCEISLEDKGEVWKGVVNFEIILRKD
jgi:hypothetical protein